MYTRFKVWLTGPDDCYSDLDFVDRLVQRCMCNSDFAAVDCNVLRYSVYKTKESNDEREGT